MRIVLLGSGVQPIPPTGYGAVERILAEFQAALRAAGQEVEVVNEVRHRRMRDEYPFALHLPRLLDGRPYDVLHANSPVVANRLAFSGLPFVYTSHSRHWFYRAGLTHRWGYWLERRAVRRAASVVALTPRLAKTMADVVRPPRPPITVIPFGVDADRYRPTWDRRSGREVLGVGVVEPFKRWEFAAAALKGLGVRLRIAGPVPMPQYADLVRASGDRVELLGEVPGDDLLRLYAESDLLVHPSRVEVLSSTVLEALAAGLPVVGGSPLAGVVEDGQTGFVVPDLDRASFVAGLRDRVHRLLEDDVLRRSLGTTARNVAVDRYSWSRIVEQHLAVYRSVATRSGAA